MRSTIIFSPGALNATFRITFSLYSRTITAGIVMRISSFLTAVKAVFVTFMAVSVPLHGCFLVETVLNHNIHCRYAVLHIPYSQTIYF